MHGLQAVLELCIICRQLFVGSPVCHFLLLGMDFGESVTVLGTVNVY